MIYKIVEHTGLFNITKSYLHHEMDRGSKAAGVKRIRIHDLRHSACAALIELGFSPVQIAERLGHESASITMRYAHLYPSVQRTMADILNDMYNIKDNFKPIVIDVNKDIVPIKEDEIPLPVTGDIIDDEQNLTDEDYELDTESN